MFERRLKAPPFLHRLPFTFRRWRFNRRRIIKFEAWVLLLMSPARFYHVVSMGAAFALMEVNPKHVAAHLPIAAEVEPLKTIPLIDPHKFILTYCEEEHFSLLRPNTSPKQVRYNRLGQRPRR